MSSAFNTDTDALRKRAELNAAKAKYNLEEWILQQIPPPSALRILDLGCGVGKQLFRLAPLVTATGSLLGVDLSENAVRAVNDRANAEGIAYVEARQMSLDDCVGSLVGQGFDLILSSYAIYYATDMIALLQDLRTLLRDGGSVFVCGPGQGTNREIIDIVNRFISHGSEKLQPIEDFLTPTGVREVARGYSRSIVSRLENVIVFDSPVTLLEWWTRHNSFIPSVAAKVQQRVNDHFANNRTFPLTKNVLGVRFDV
jgi:SAM-dependent methyltransferase